MLRLEARPGKCLKGGNPRKVPMASVPLGAITAITGCGRRRSAGLVCGWLSAGA